MLSDPLVKIAPMVIALVALAGAAAGRGLSWSVASHRIATVRMRSARLGAELEAARRETARTGGGRATDDAGVRRRVPGGARPQHPDVPRPGRYPALPSSRRWRGASSTSAGRRSTTSSRRCATRLTRVETSIAGIERARQEAYAGLTAQVRGLTETHERLRAETPQLAGALRSPQVRGRWGEVQLRRVVELAGMLPHCDFVEQATLTRAGTIRRPDLVVKLPGGRRHRRRRQGSRWRPTSRPTTPTTRTSGGCCCATTPDSCGPTSTRLSEKAYWEQFADSPDLVVLFLPGEPFLAAAYEHDPDLFEYAHGRRVLLATPTTLIALLQSIAVGWRQESMAANARAVFDVGRELYKRLATMGEHVRAASARRSTRRSRPTTARSARSRRGCWSPPASSPPSTSGTASWRPPEPIERSARGPQTAELTRWSSVTDPEVA